MMSISYILKAKAFKEIQLDSKLNFNCELILCYLYYRLRGFSCLDSTIFMSKISLLYPLTSFQLTKINM